MEEVYMDAFLALLLIFFVFYLTIFAAAVLNLIATYVLKSLGMYTIAKRRGISKPWLAWVPFGQSWMLGCISDQYQMVAKGKQKSKRRLLLTLDIAYCVIYGLYMLATYAGELSPLLLQSGAGEAVEILLFVQSLCMFVFGISVMVISITYTVYHYIAFYDLYRSCNPRTAVLFLILNIFLPTVVGAVFVLVDCKKDLGMPAPDDGFEAAVLQEPAE